MGSRFYHWVLAFFIATPAMLTVPVDAAELPARASVLDENVIMYLRPVPLVSPNGRYVAYVSRGFVCVAEIEAATSHQLAEVPDSWTHVFATADETRGGGDADSVGKLLGAEKDKALQAQVKNEVGAFQWTIDSEAIVYSVHSYDATKQTTLARVFRAPIVGEPKQIASNEREISIRRGPGNLITRDGRFLVGNFGRDRALIWDLATNKPRATPYLNLAPSPSSGRWLGVEKDSRQLVVVDEDFKVIKRYGEILPKNQFGFDMIWSPDERFAFWRQQIGFDYYSNWTGCRYDLQTGDRQIFTGDYMDERIIFTGHRGEFIRVGAAGVQRAMSGLDLVEQYVGLVPDGRLHLQRFWSLRADTGTESSQSRRMGSMSNVTWALDFQMFTIGMARQEGPYGEILHLANRQRQLWKMPGEDGGAYISPYHVAGFALNSTVVIAFDSTRIFALPVAAIQSPENKVR